jgi:thiol-disulfide isomerase/thioredoxin
LPRAGGGRLDFSDFRGRVLLVDFFTTWNQASILAIPGLASLHRRYAARGLAVVGVALDELGEDVVLPYAVGMEIPYPVVLATDRIRNGKSPFGDLSALPSLFVFDSHGRLRKVLVGYVPLERIERLVVALLP